MTPPLDPIEALFKEGYNTVEVAQRLGIPRREVRLRRDWLRDQGRLPLHLTRDERRKAWEEARRGIQAGDDPDAIAERTGLTRQQIAYFARRNHTRLLQIADLLNAGQSPPEIADALDLKRTSIYSYIRALREKGLWTGPRWPKPKPTTRPGRPPGATAQGWGERWPEARNALDQGMSPDEASSRFGVSQKRAKWYLETVKPNGGTAYQRVLAALSPDKSTTQIANELGIPRSTVSVYASLIRHRNLAPPPRPSIEHNLSATRKQLSESLSLEHALAALGIKRVETFYRHVAILAERGVAIPAWAKKPEHVPMIEKVRQAALANEPVAVTAAAIGVSSNRVREYRSKLRKRGLLPKPDPKEATYVRPKAPRTPSQMLGRMLASFTDPMQPFAQTAEQLGVEVAVVERVADAVRARIEKGEPLNEAALLQLLPTHQPPPPPSPSLGPRFDRHQRDRLLAHVLLGLVQGESVGTTALRLGLVGAEVEAIHAALAQGTPQKLVDETVLAPLLPSTAERVARCAERGMTLQATADLLEVSVMFVNRLREELRASGRLDRRVGAKRGRKKKTVAAAEALEEGVEEGLINGDEPSAEGCDDDVRGMAGRADR